MEINGTNLSLFFKSKLGKKLAPLLITTIIGQVFWLGFSVLAANTYVSDEEARYQLGRAQLYGITGLVQETVDEIKRRRNDSSSYQTISSVSFYISIISLLIFIFVALYNKENILNIFHGPVHQGNVTANSGSTVAAAGATVIQNSSNINIKKVTPTDTKQYVEELINNINSILTDNTIDKLDRSHAKILADKISNETMKDEMNNEKVVTYINDLSSLLQSIGRLGLSTKEAINNVLSLFN